MSKQTILTVNDLRFSYPTHDAVLTGISFECYEGERIALIGPNGSGKTGKQSLLLVMWARVKQLSFYCFVEF